MSSLQRSPEAWLLLDKEAIKDAMPPYLVSGEERANLIEAPSQERRLRISKEVAKLELSQFVVRLVADEAL